MNYNERKAYNREYYSKHRASCLVQMQTYYREHKEERSAATKAYIERNKQWLKHYKETQQCLICGEDCVVCLDFHHPDGDKGETIGKMPWSFGIQQMQREIDKCVVLCANCHRKVHHSVIKLEDYIDGEISLENNVG